MTRTYCMTSGVVFALVALLHAWRVVLRLPLEIGAWSVPQSLSVVAAIGAAALSVWAFRNARTEKPVSVAYT